MFDFLRNLFETDGFPARWYCGSSWTPVHGYMHILSDIATWGAYTTIPILLILYGRKRRGFPFNGVFFLFAAFILACGLVHLIDAIIFYYPIYRVSAVMKVITAAVSWATVIALFRLIPTALELPGLKSANKALEDEIKARRDAEKRLLESETRFRLTFENAAVGIAHVGLDGTWLRANDRLSAIIGYTTEVLLQKTFQEITHPDDLDQDLELLEEVVAGDRKDYTIEKRYFHSSGRIVWVLLTVSLVRDSEGNPDYFISIIQDISDRKSVEQRLEEQDRKLILAKELAAVGVMDADYSKPEKEVILDELAAKMFCLPAFTPISRTTVHDRIHPEDRKLLHESIEECLNSNNDGRLSLQMRINRDDGSIGWVNARTQFTFEEGKSWPTEALIAVVDVTEQKRYEQILEVAKAEAEAANEARGQFLANVSHEIRTPLSAIMGHVDVLRTHMSDPDNIQVVMTIKRNSEHLLGIINDILDLSRIEAGRMELNVEDCDPLRLMLDVESLLNVRVDPAAVSFEFQTDSPIPSRVQADNKRIKQILLNLVGNAIKFTKEGFVRVTAEFDAKSETLQFTVADSGIGIPQRLLKSLFQPFNQGDSSRTRQYGGSGLGLAISKRFAELMNAQLTVESAESQGSTFVLKIPVSQWQEPMQRMDDWSEPAEDNDEDFTPIELKCHVLLVDDRRDIRFIGQHFLEDAGATVITANDGQEAIAKAQAAVAENKPFDIIVMDVQMPVLDGVSAVIQLRKEGWTVPIIALTADAMEEDRQRCLQAGYNDYLTKPVDARQLVSRVHQLLNTNHVDGE